MRWPGPSGSAPPGTIGPWTRRRRRAGRDPAYTGSVAVPPTGCRGQWPTPHAYAKWPRFSEMRRRRRQPRPRTEPRHRGAVRPSRRRSQQPRGLRRCRRARAKRLPGPRLGYTREDTPGCGSRRGGACPGSVRRPSRTVSAIALAAGAHGAYAEGRGSAGAAPSAPLPT